MAFVVEDGTGKTDSNSYVSVAEFEAYWLDRNNDMSGETTADKQSWLINATQYIDLNYTFAGEVSNDDQALQWPRTYTYDNKGNVIDSDSIPNQLKYAVCELAKINKTQTNLTTNVDKVKSKKIGPVSTTFKDVIKIDPYQNTTNYMKSFLAYTGSLGVVRV